MHSWISQFTWDPPNRGCLSPFMATRWWLNLNMVRDTEPQSKKKNRNQSSRNIRLVLYTCCLGTKCVVCEGDDADLSHLLLIYCTRLPHGRKGTRRRIPWIYTEISRRHSWIRINPWHLEWTYLSVPSPQRASTFLTISPHNEILRRWPIFHWLSSPSLLQVQVLSRWLLMTGRVSRDKKSFSRPTRISVMIWGGLGVAYTFVSPPCVCGLLISGICVPATDFYGTSCYDWGENEDTEVSRQPRYEILVISIFYSSGNAIHGQGLLSAKTYSERLQDRWHAIWKKILDWK